jgi:serine/threonine protein kinase
MPLSAGARLGPYEILAPIGAGGMGEVYRARDTRLSRQVAIKVLPGHLAKDPEALDRFRREAIAVAALAHPNILVLYDVGSEQEVRYAVTELLEGETLRERLSRGPLPWRKVAQLGSALAEGLAAAHSKGIVHQDIKPANIFLTSDGRVKILDFSRAGAREKGAGGQRYFFPGLRVV